MSWKTYCEWIADRKATCLAVFRAEIQRFVLAMVPNFDILLELKTPQNRDEYLPSVIWTFSKKVKSSTKLLKSLNVYLHSTLSLIISTSWISNFQTSVDEIKAFISKGTEKTIYQGDASSVNIFLIGSEKTREMKTRI